MLRTLALAAAATFVIGAAALNPTAASAHGWRGHHSGWGHHFRGPRYGFAYRPVYAGSYGCLRPRWVPTPWGPRRRLVNVCY